MPYLDSSALAKIYAPETGSEDLENSILGRDDLLISDLVVTEAASALGRRRREGTISQETANVFHQTILRDLSDGFFRHVDLNAGTHRHAERLLLASAIPLRAGDALHLALAMAARAGVIVTFDDRLARAARQAGIGTVPDLPYIER